MSETTITIKELEARSAVHLHEKQKKPFRKPWYPTQFNNTEPSHALPSASEVESHIRAMPGPRWRGVVLAEVLLAGRSPEAAVDAVIKLDAMSDRPDVAEHLYRKSLTTATELLEQALKL